MLLMFRLPVYCGFCCCYQSSLLSLFIVLLLLLCTIYIEMPAFLIFHISTAKIHCKIERSPILLVSVRASSAYISAARLRILPSWYCLIFNLPSCIDSECKTLSAMFSVQKLDAVVMLHKYQLLYHFHMDISNILC